jgi:hypothetical protein
MGVNSGFMVFMASRSNAELRTVIKEFSATHVDGNPKYSYRDFWEFDLPNEPDERGVFEVRVEGVYRYQLGRPMKADLTALQAKYPDVLIALYEYDAEYDTIGLVMTGVKQWSLLLGDEDLAMRIAFDREEDDISIPGA